MSLERDSLIYKTRRKLQVLAHKIVSDEALSKFYYRIVMKEDLSFDDPKTFNEKIQWMKLYYFPYDPMVVKGADKYAVREYVEQKGLGHLLNDLLGVWEQVDQITWDSLPDKFVLKCNHGCAYNILCDDKASFNKTEAEMQLKQWLKEDFGAFNLELHYSRIKPRRIICEEYLGSMITDYKFFCFNGEPKFIYISEDLVHDRKARIGFYGIDRSKLPMVKASYADLNDAVFPEYFDSMVNDARTLASDFPFVRVDFFVMKERYYFSELTFTPGGGMNDFNPPEYDTIWGKELDISDVMKEYGKYRTKK